MSSLNWDKEFALEQAADDAELLEELLDIFRNSSADDLKQIKKGIDTNDPQIVGGAAHSIKGAAASLGILGIRDVAMVMEADARNGSISVAKDKYPLLEQMTKELIDL